MKYAQTGKKLYSDKEIPSSSMELHLVHCRRNYTKCECGEVVHRQNIESHKLEKHTAQPCKNCGIEYLPDLLKTHDCPAAPKICQFCNAEFPFAQFSDHLYSCASRTEQCPRCFKYIQIRDFQHHFEAVDCLGTTNKFQERLDKITAEVYDSFTGSPEEIEAEIYRRVTEDEDREYAEEVYKKLLMERSPSRDSQIDEANSKRIEDSKKISEDAEAPESRPEIRRGVSENSFGISDEDQLMNEAIMNSLKDH